MEAYLRVFSMNRPPQILQAKLGYQLMDSKDTGCSAMAGITSSQRLGATGGCAEWYT